MDYRELQDKFKKLAINKNYECETELINNIDSWRFLERGCFDELLSLKSKLGLLECILKENLSAKGYEYTLFREYSLVQLIDRYYINELDLIGIRNFLVSTSNLISRTTYERIDDKIKEIVDMSGANKLWDLCMEIELGYLRENKAIDMRVLEIEYEQC